MKKRCSRNWSTEKFYFAERFLQRCGTFHRLVTHVVSCKHLRVAPLNVATFGAAHLAVVGVVQSASSRCIAPFFHSSVVAGRAVTNTRLAVLHPMQMQASSHCIGTYTRHVLRSPSVVALNRKFAKAQRSLHGSMQMQASSHCIGTCTRHVLLVRASSL